MRNSLLFRRRGVIISLSLCVALTGISSGSVAKNIRTNIKEGNGYISVVTENRSDTADRADSIAFVKAKWTKKRLGHGAELRYARIRMFNSIQSISMVIYPTKYYVTDILQADKAAVTSELARSLNADFAVNGSFFNTHNGQPVTFVMVNKVVKETSSTEKYDKRSNGMLAVDRSNTSCTVNIMPCKIDEFGEVERSYTSALASGPILMTNGIIPVFTNSVRHPRTIMGMTNKGRNIIMMVVDGRSKGNADGMSYKESATVARYMKMKDVINLDGGGSSTLWTRKEGVVNHPCDNHIFDHMGERKVSNIVYVCRKMR